MMTFEGTPERKSREVSVCARDRSLRRADSLPPPTPQNKEFGPAQGMHGATYTVDLEVCETTLNSRWSALLSWKCIRSCTHPAPG